jgi:hypothetical protein
MTLANKLKNYPHELIDSNSKMTFLDHVYYQKLLDKCKYKILKKAYKHTGALGMNESSIHTPLEIKIKSYKFFY